MSSDFFPTLTGEPAMGEFTELLGKLEDLQKASGAVCADDKEAISDKDEKKDSADDKKIEAAAKDGEKESDKEEKETFGKAFKVKLEDGTETEAFDGTAMLKALHTENELLRQTMTERDAELAKAFDIVVTVLGEQRQYDADQTKQLVAQDTLIKALQAKVDSIGQAGVGRRTMLAIAEKLSPSAGIVDEKPKPTGGQILAKAMFMAREGKLDWGSAVRIEAYQGRGEVAPADLLARYPELLTPVP
jgi:hypothetical protein